METKGSLIIPSVRYRDAHAGIAWLEKVLGLQRQAVFEGPDGRVAHAQLTYGGGMLMIGSTDTSPHAARWVQPDEIGDRETAGMCLIVEDCEAAYQKAKAAGAEIVGELHEPEYGGKAFNCKDPEGHVWWVGSYNPWS
jgi:uncharacterized glyoxalase superfamily protein PhnB